MSTTMSRVRAVAARLPSKASINAAALLFLISASLTCSGQQKPGTDSLGGATTGLHGSGPLPGPTVGPAVCRRNLAASIVALDQVMVINRLGTVRPAGLMFALERDVVSRDGGARLEAGKVQLREDKRPRPIGLRMNVGDCLEIHFSNLLAPDAPTSPLVTTAAPIFTRQAGIHAAGLSPVDSAGHAGSAAGGPDDGSFVGQNDTSLVAPGGSRIYKLYAPAEGSFLLYSTAADFNGVSTQQLTLGLFGAVNVEPRDAEWYRSQVTSADLEIARKKGPDGHPLSTPDGHPVLDYDALYPADYDALHPGSHRRACSPVLKMLDVRRTVVSDNGRMTCRDEPGSLELYHTDLTAIITGPRAGRFPDSATGPSFEPSPEYPDRRAPFREVTIHYHESQDVLQPFPVFYDQTPDAHGLAPTYTLTKGLDSSGSDAFAINYGIAGIGPEVFANRLKVGPMFDCPECKFEEFFLSSWTSGDPSMVVDVPANAPLTVEELIRARDTGVLPKAAPKQGRKATRAFFPDDPSNVYHSYLGDRAMFRILHAGASVHHVHHHHAHQWLRTPDSDESHYLDSQAIGPGAAFSLELVHGSGNRNLTAGDSIFHCHFYPHFASGMWGLFRVHDVFEQGTELDATGRPTADARALPDAEILHGTPIPAVVPLPTLPMAPMPERVKIEDGQARVLGKKNPGFPFFVPGVAGHRAPAPPMDFAVEKGEELNGGLPRHVILAGEVVNEQHSSWDFSKDLGKITAAELPENGTPVEESAMAAHAIRKHPSYRPDGSPGVFVMNGRRPAPGAPYADPAVDLNGDAPSEGGKPAPLRRYKGANLQVDAVLNRKGWHFPQQRMMVLWDDLNPTLKGDRPPEPLFFRANSGDVIEYWHTNLVPSYYELDDFQVRTPTDILGQHIHLVKFDVTSSDGAANGFNYEDGTLGADEVRDRIGAINAAGGLWSADRKKRSTLTPRAIPELGAGPNGAWVGAQATIQRWYADPILDRKGHDRTLTTVFTHDHFGPSTHQQAGLYGGLLIEPRGSRWTAPDGAPFGGRADGGPTSYAANILTEGAVDSYREFALAFHDLQLTYGPQSPSAVVPYRAKCEENPTFANCVLARPDPRYTGWASPRTAINPPTCDPGLCPAPTGAQPGLISNFGSGTLSVNYRAESLAMRLATPSGARAPLSPEQAEQATDPSQAFRSIERLDPAFNQQPKGGSVIDDRCDPAKSSCFTYPRQPITAAMLPNDPYTPLLRAYANDRVQIRVLAGGQTSMHTFGLNGNKWLYDPDDTNSGYRASQFVILSEHFEMHFDTPPARPGSSEADYLYQAGSSYEGLVNGIWGLLRAYDGKRAAPGLAHLPSNAVAAPPVAVEVPAGFNPDCGSGTPCLRNIKVSAMTVAQALGDRRGLVYNGRGITTRRPGSDRELTAAPAPLVDPDALIYVRDEDIDEGTGRLKPGTPVEPLVLRAAAGDWIKVTLRNRLNVSEPVFESKVSAARPGVFYAAPYQGIDISASRSVGLHPQLLAYDVTRSDGVNVGTNPIETVPPRDPRGNPGSACTDYPCREYLWYAGSLATKPDGTVESTPVELGAVNLMPSDPLLHTYHGLFGALVVEPLGSIWVEDPDSRASATVFAKDGSVFRDFTLIEQNDVAVKMNDIALYDLPTANPLSAVNYRSEPMFYRFGAKMDAGWAAQERTLGGPPPKDWAHPTKEELDRVGRFDWTYLDTHDSFSSSLVNADPETPIYRAPAGMPVRFRLLGALGNGDNQQVFELAGHAWEDEPYTQGSTVLGHNPLSTWSGALTGYGPAGHFDVLVASAGGAFQVPGDYLYRSWTATQTQVGLWGLLRVTPPRQGGGYPDIVSIDHVSTEPAGGHFFAEGAVTIHPTTRAYAKSVELTAGEGPTAKPIPVPVDDHGRWTYRGDGAAPARITVTSPSGGVATYRSGATAPVLGGGYAKRPASGRKR